MPTFSDLISTTNHKVNKKEIQLSKKTSDTKSFNVTDWWSIYVAAMLSFIGSMQFSLYFSSMWPYLQMVSYEMVVSQLGCKSLPLVRSHDNRNVLWHYDNRIQCGQNCCFAVDWMVE